MRARRSSAISDFAAIRAPNLAGNAPLEAKPPQRPHTSFKVRRRAKQDERPSEARRHLQVLEPRASARKSTIWGLARMRSTGRARERRALEIWRQSKWADSYNNLVRLTMIAPRWPHIDGCRQFQVHFTITFESCGQVRLAELGLQTEKLLAGEHAQVRRRLRLATCGFGARMMDRLPPVWLNSPAAAIHDRWARARCLPAGRERAHCIN